MTNRQGVTVDSFIRRIYFGDDVEFECNGRMFTILGWADGGPSVAEQKTLENEAQFSDGKDLVMNYVIDGKTLIERFHEIRFL